MERVLVTGGAGFIGNEVVNCLQGKYHIRVLDNLSKQIHGVNPEQSYLYNNIKEKVEFILGDVTNKKDMDNALNEVDYIIHLASETGTGQSMYEMNKYSQTNLLGTSNLLETILEKKIRIKKIVLSSSRSVYGEGEYFCTTHGKIVPNSRDVKNMKKGDYECKCPICNNKVILEHTSEDSKLKPISYYALTKMTQENMLELMCPSMGVDYTIFRYQNVYGAGQSLNNPYTGILSIFSKLLLADKTINIFEDGLESRDFVHVKDVAKLTVDSLTNAKSNNEIINVGTGEQVTVLEVANTLKNLYHSNSTVQVTGDFRVGDIRHNIANIKKASTIFHYIPNFSFKDGMTDFTEWVVSEYNQNKVELSNDDFSDSIKELKKTGMLFNKEG